ncbi:uncharacterized protein LOC141673394 [Apium graveolens]|uniref:uncharacterized protein LOC141673394 n=1 Tax=Apium graveolens TaxID=4045 RepID=UPI003D7A772F
MDRSWLKADRRTQEFKLGVDELLNFAFSNGFKENKISCPCLRCAHSKSWNARTVKDHLYQYGINQTYMCWICHGESNYVQSHVVSEHDTSESSVDPTNMRMGQNIVDDEDISLDSSDFMNHVQGENEPLYPGCESFTKMRDLVKLYNLKAKHGISDKCFSDVLLLLASMLPKGNGMPSSFGEAKKTLCTLGMDYEKIHACPNDCLLYHSERDEDEMIFRICGASRWKLNKKGEEVEGIPAKVLWLATYKKTDVMRHRRWLPRNHPYRRQKSAFDNTVEKLSAPIPLTGEEVLERVLPLADHIYGKTQNQPRWKKGEPRPIWKKMSIFFQLEYWKFLPVRHTLDVMHIEKNICEALTGTFLNIPRKTKDREYVRIDMAEMGIRMELRPKNPGKKEKLPMASWNLLHKEKKIVCSYLIGMKLPGGFCLNLKGIVSMDTLRLVGMKSHDCHTMLHHLLLIALRSILQKQARCTIIRFCLFFKAICSKVIEVDKIEKMQSQLVETLCQLEKHFPPSLFDVMIYLSVHLVREVELCGPIFLRWMYPFERYMKPFKGYVRNRAHPEGCIAEAYIAEEAVQWLVNFEEPTVGLPGRDKNKEKYRHLSGATMIKPSIKDLHQAHLCLLQNSNKLTPYFNEHMAFLVARYPLHENDEEWLKNKQNETFPNWFQKKISSELLDVKSMVSKEVMWLAEGPNKYVPTFSGYKINGVTYNIKDRDETRKVQCSGVCLHADIMFVQDMNKGVKIDDLGYTVVNLHKLGFLNDPFVLGKHVKQVCYIDDPLEKFWSIVLKLPDKFDDQSDDENEGSVEIELENEVIQTTSKTPLSETLLLNRAGLKCKGNEKSREGSEDYDPRKDAGQDVSEGDASVTPSKGKKKINKKKMLMGRGPTTRSRANSAAKPTTQDASEKEDTCRSIPVTSPAPIVDLPQADDSKGSMATFWAMRKRQKE